MIKFGESTRLYALEGPQELLPAEYESDNLVSEEKHSTVAIKTLSLPNATHGRYDVFLSSTRMDAEGRVKVKP